MHLKDFLSFLVKNEVLDKFQSGFRMSHSTQSALLRVVNDLRIIRDSGNSAALILLHLSSIQFNIICIALFTKQSLQSSFTGN